jgi:hypothetical protein
MNTSKAMDYLLLWKRKTVSRIKMLPEQMMFFEKDACCLGPGRDYPVSLNGMKCYFVAEQSSLP